MIGEVLLLGSLGLAWGGKTTLTIQKAAEWWSPSRNTASSAEHQSPADPIFSVRQLRRADWALSPAVGAAGGGGRRRHTHTRAQKRSHTRTQVLIFTICDAKLDARLACRGNNLFSSPKQMFYDKEQIQLTLSGYSLPSYWFLLITRFDLHNRM